MLSEILVRARVRRVLLFAGVVLAVLPAGSALADTTVGQTGTPIATSSFTAGFERVQTDAAVTAAGVVTSLNTQSSSSCGVVRGTYDFQVLRPVGGNQYRVLGDTGNQTDPCDGQLHSYPVNIPVRAEDVLGFYVVQNWRGVLSFSGSQKFASIARPGVGDTVTLPNQASGTVNESATVGCQDPTGAFNHGFNSGFNPGFNSGWNSEFPQAYRSHGAWQVGWQRGFVAGRRSRTTVHAVRESARAARPAVAPCDAAFNSGFNPGFNSGFNSGFNAAYKFAFNQGYRSGFAKGRAS